MKKLIVILFLFIAAFTVQAQHYVPDPNATATTNITNNAVHNGWALIGTTCAGCPSYYFKITETTAPVYAEDGRPYYYYYIWFFSNSYYSNGQPALTYLTSVNAYINGQYITKLDYALVSREARYFVWLRSPVRSSISFQVVQMSVY